MLKNTTKIGIPAYAYQKKGSRLQPGCIFLHEPFFFYKKRGMTVKSFNIDKWPFFTPNTGGEGFQ